MGLDTVELVMEVEETFQIEIPNREASEIVTVGDLHALVLKKLEGQGEGCLSAVAFYRLRRGFMDAFNQPRDAISLCRGTEELVPVANRRSDWQRLLQTLGLRLPSLERPPWVISACTFTLVMSALVTFGLVFFFSRSLLFPFLASIVSVTVVGFAAYYLTVPLAVCVPWTCNTVRDTVRSLVKYNFGKIAASGKQWNQAEVWNTLRQIVAEQLGVDVERVTRNARFVQDLGAD